MSIIQVWVVKGIRFCWQVFAGRLYHAANLWVDYLFASHPSNRKYLMVIFDGGLSIFPGGFIHQTWICIHF